MTKTGLYEGTAGSMVPPVNSESVMANLYIDEYGELDNPNGPLPLKPLAKQKVAFTTAALSAAFNAATKFIRIYGDAAFHLSYDGSAAPTAATAAFARFTTSLEYVRKVNPLAKLSVYDGSS